MLEPYDDNYQQRKLIATSVASPIASLLAKFITYPIDTVKTKIQASRVALHSLSSYRMGHSLAMIKDILKQEGIRGFYPGVTIASLGSIIAFSAYMTAYQRSKVLLQRKEFWNSHPTLKHFVSGFAAQFFSCILWLPIDIIKERMQVQSVVKLYHYESARDAAKKIHGSEGLIGLYRAFGATLVFFGPFSALFFACYEQIKEWVVKDDKKQTLIESMICSSGAGAISGFLTNPLQMVKMRMQIQRADSAIKGVPLNQTLYGYRNIFHGLYLLTQRQGVLALYKGAGMRVLFVVPVTTLSISLTEYFRRLILNTKLPQYFI